MLLFDIYFDTQLCTEVMSRLSFLYIVPGKRATSVVTETCATVEIWFIYNWQEFVGL